VDRPKKKLHIEGRLHGYVKGEIDAFVEGTISGEIQPVRDDSEEPAECAPDRKDVDYEES